MKKGFTLLETLIACLFIPLTMSLVVSMLHLMKEFKADTLNQEDIFKVQFRQMLSRSKILDCEEAFTFSKNNQTFELSLHNQRLVKRPGFEILLYGVDAFSFEYLDERCVIYYEHRGKKEVLKIPYQY